MNVPPPVQPVPSSARTLLEGVVDYAGLFPPAQLEMRAAVAEYAAALAGDDAWMLGRFVLPAARLPQLAEARAEHTKSAARWQLSAIVADASDADMAAIAAFNDSAIAPLAIVDAIECRPSTVEGIDWLADRAAAKYDVFVEVANSVDPAPWVERIAARGLSAKIRTGGTTADAFPSPRAIVRFLEAVVATRVTFKATAGLHHAVRGSYRLTYAEDAAAAPMYGYLNVLLATAALASGQPAALAEDLLQRADAASLTFTDDGVRWQGLELPNDLLRRTRAAHLVGFGSCSFREPAGELAALVAPGR